MQRKIISMSLESYLEEIAVLQYKYGAVSTSVLAEHMGCKRSSVTNALQKLSEKGLIKYQAYHPVILTEAGRRSIDRLTRYHAILAEFLTKILDFPDEFAQAEACRLEHLASPKTIERLGLYNQYYQEKAEKSFSQFLSEKKKETKSGDPV